MKRVEWNLKKQPDDKWIAYEKIYEPLTDEEDTKKFTTWIDNISNGTDALKALFSNSPFDYPKSPTLVRHLMKMANADTNSIILDFFSGSATTAQAVMELNAADNGQRKFIMVQIPELVNEKSEAFKAGYKTICDIGIERIKRAADKIKSEMPLNTQNLDTGFRVLELDDGNFKNVFLPPQEYTQDLLSDMEENIKNDLNAMDLLFGFLIECGKSLTLPFSSKNINGFEILIYNNGEVIACFNSNIPNEIFNEIANLFKTLGEDKNIMRYAVFRDKSFNNDNTEAKNDAKKLFEFDNKINFKVI